MTDVYLVSAVRTPIGRFGGAFLKHSAADLGGIAMKAALERGGVEGEALDFYQFGNVLRAGHGQLIARQAAFSAGIPKSVDGCSVDMVCSSGMMSILNAAAMIKAGDAHLVLAGGTESMSNAGFYLSSKARWGYKYLVGPNEPVMDVMFRDGLSDFETGEAMGDQTERLASERGVTREEMDEVAALSHQRAEAATADGTFEKEIVPVEYRVKRDTKTLAADEGIRAGTTAESLAGLRPAFSKDGVITAGNASQLSDGAAAVLVASAEAVREHGLTPLAKLTSYGWSAGEPYRFAEAPLPAVTKMLEKTGASVEDFDLVENNEAFAINSVLIRKQLGVPYDKLNVHGGAIALGHPIGCSGARIVVTLLNALATRGGSTGIASICHGTGGGTALAVEMV